MLLQNMWGNESDFDLDQAIVFVVAIGRDPFGRARAQLIRFEDLGRTSGGSSFAAADVAVL